ncbi:hypothetical protein MAR_036142 [Mya arenaria]|uniref:Uncharacterized protein n=1 Tax=Mya arenaria TaxID=6604 RepID=A0ABY7EV37_MYAAR|nr:hypothetical protein MAR_036142 [Mya arenaria]
MASCWRDTKPVMLLIHDPDGVGAINRGPGNPEQQHVWVPKAIEDYQRHMQGLDLFDQMMSAAHNAYVIAHDNNPEVIQLKWPQFQDLAEDLIENYKASRAAPLTNIENLPPVPRTT